MSENIYAVIHNGKVKGYGGSPERARLEASMNSPLIYLESDLGQFDDTDWWGYDRPRMVRITERLKNAVTTYTQGLERNRSNRPHMTVEGRIYDLHPNARE